MGVGTFTIGGGCTPLLDAIGGVALASVTTGKDGTLMGKGVAIEGKVNVKSSAGGRGTNVSTFFDLVSCRYSIREGSFNDVSIKNNRQSVTTASLGPQ